MKERNQNDGSARLPFDPDSVPTDSRWPPILAVAAGGCIGGVSRYLLGLALPAGTYAFPWATLSINVAGCFLLTVLLVLLEHHQAKLAHVREFVGVGMLGGFTTFSTWMVEIDQLGDVGEQALAVAYLSASIVAGAAAVVLAMAATRAVTGSR